MRLALPISFEQLRPVLLLLLPAVAGGLLLFAPQLEAADKVITIYQDADLSNHSESAKSIQLGIELAFDEIGNEIAGHKVKFKYLDHRGNVLRSKRNFQKFVNDPTALAIYSGIHSPPLIKNRTLINQLKALTLVPWAAGGPVTRHPSPENWIFRLSIDDTLAGPVLVNFAMGGGKCRRPHLLLEDTPWGDSNLASMSAALANYNITAPDLTRFNWNLSASGARLYLRQIVDNNADCILLVANAIEGAVIAEALLDIPVEKRPAIISHWGIVAGKFQEIITAEKRAELDLHFIQTCFAFTNKSQSVFVQNVFEKLQKFTKGDIAKPADLKAATGFIHAYDLTKLLIVAIGKAGLSGDIEKDRDAVRQALEAIEGPIEGLVKTYSRPFSIFDEVENRRAHEALNLEDFCMGKFGKSDEVLLIQ